MKVESFEHACSIVGIDTTLPDFSFAPKEDQQAFVDHYKLAIIHKAARKLANHVADWGNGSQPKFSGWFNMGGSSGAGFSCGDYDGWRACSAVGSRLSAASEEDMEYIATDFADLYKSYFLIEPAE